MQVKKIIMEPKCGEIWLCNIPAGTGSVQSGIRPVFILSNNKNNAYATTLNVIPMTSKNKNPIPVHVKIDDYWKYGLREKSTLLVEQLTTVSRENLIGYVGTIPISDSHISELLVAMRIQFPIFARVA